MENGGGGGGVFGVRWMRRVSGRDGRRGAVGDEVIEPERAGLFGAAVLGFGGVIVVVGVEGSGGVVDGVVEADRGAVGGGRRRWSRGGGGGVFGVRWMRRVSGRGGAQRTRHGGGFGRTARLQRRAIGLESAAEERGSFGESGRLVDTGQTLGAGNRVVVMLVIDHEMASVILVLVSVNIVRAKNSGLDPMLLSANSIMLVRVNQWPKGRLLRTKAI